MLATTKIFVLVEVFVSLWHLLFISGFVFIEQHPSLHNVQKIRQQSSRSDSSDWKTTTTTLVDDQRRCTSQYFLSKIDVCRQEQLLFQRKHTLFSTRTFASISSDIYDYDDVMATSSSSSSNPYRQRRTNIELALLDILSISDDENDISRMMIQPLPSDHLPDELATLNVYGMVLTRPIHQMIVQHSKIDTTTDDDTPVREVYGHIAYKPSSSSNIDGDYTGAIGCATTVLMTATPESLQGIPQDVLDFDKDFNANQQQQTVLCRGSYRFIVKEVIRTVPYLVALVDELFDDDDMHLEDPNDARKAEALEMVMEDDDVDEEEDVDEFTSLTRSELVQKTLFAMKCFVDIQKEEISNLEMTMSPLEESILDDYNSARQMFLAQKRATDEMVAVYDFFTSITLIDDIVIPSDQDYAIAFLAAEIADFTNNVRRQMLITTNPMKRLRIVLKQLNEMIGMKRAERVATSVVQKTDNDDKELKVGVPILPIWAKQIQKGTKLEYYWNDEFEWCTGTVVEDPIYIVDEILLIIYFDDDRTIHKIPFTGDDKARWRPPSK